MRLNGLKYSRKFSLGNYEMEEISVDASVEEGENPSTVLEAMMEFVLTKGKTSPTPVKAQPDKKEEVAETKAPEQLVLKEVAEENKKATKSEKSKKNANNLPSESIENRAQSKSSTVIPKKATVYDRSLDLHKKLVSELLDNYFPSWRSNPAKAKDVSLKLEGAEFLDNEGIVLKAFKDSFIAAMKA